MTSENSARNPRIILAAAALVLTVVLTLFADRLLVERKEGTSSEQIVTLRRDVDEVKNTFIRKEAIEPRLQAIEKAILDFDRRQEKMMDMVQNMVRQGRKDK